ncbi:MAG: tRNA-intron lyase [Candidatus Aenigmatarchaeota archaeon]
MDKNLNDEPKGQIQLDERIKNIECEFAENKIVVWDKRESVYEPGFYGKLYEDRLELSLVEACLLLKRGKIKVMKDSHAMSFDELYAHGCKVDERFPERFRVYEDLRERGLLVRTGFKFGCDFRVYERGVKLKKGPKSQSEHTKWIVFAVPEDYTCGFQELSRAVRLAHNIRAKMLWSIVDNEGDVTYYEIVRKTP